MRVLADRPSGHDPGFWQRGAELGWTSLVVPPEAGGGSVSDQGVRDLTLVAYQFGLHRAPGPLLGSNVVAAAIGRWGGRAQQDEPLRDLLERRGDGRLGAGGGAAERCAGHVSLAPPNRGTASFSTASSHPSRAVRPRPGSSSRAHSGPGFSQFLVPAGSPGVRCAPLHSLDMTKRFARLEFDRARVPRSSLVGEAGAAGTAVGWLLDLAVTVQVAEMCGAMQWAFDTTLEWALSRYSFGRPLGSYQEIKHRFADMKLWLEASLAISARAADAVDRDAANRSELVSAAKFYVGRYGVELMQDCVQMHGGIGVTFDHHLHLFLRRVVTNTALFGTPGQRAARLTDILDGSGVAP